jgi:hypothetical protein
MDYLRGRVSSQCNLSTLPLAFRNPPPEFVDFGGEPGDLSIRKASVLSRLS